MNQASTDKKRFSSSVPPCPDITLMRMPDINGLDAIIATRGETSSSWRLPR